MTLKTMTAGELRQRVCDQLRGVPDHCEIYFGMGDLSLYRPKTRLYAADGKTPRQIQIEFNEIYHVTLDPGSDGS